MATNSGVSGFFSRGADEAVGRLGVHFRDTDPRPYPEHTTEELVERGLGLEALIPTRSPIAAAEDERLIASLAAFLADWLPDARQAEAAIAQAIRAWRDGAR